MTTPEVALLVCRRCKQSLPPERFRPHRNSSRGFRVDCRECESAQRRTPEFRAKDRAFRERNKDGINEARRERRLLARAIKPPADRTCTAPGCVETRKAKGLCKKHYFRKRSADKRASNPDARSMQPLEGEQWRLVPGFPGYQVSNIGRVVGPRGWILRTYRHNGDYRRVRIGGDQPYNRHFLVHTLVALAFLGPAPEGLMVNHKDGVHDNNRVENLEYATAAQNNDHANKVLRVYRARGSRVNTARLTEIQAVEIRRRHAQEGLSGAALGREYGVRRTVINLLLRGHTWRHAKQDLESGIQELSRRERYNLRTNK